MISVLDLFRIGVGPSSSHTVGPMRIAKCFAVSLAEAGILTSVRRVYVQFQGSLALTGVGHRTIDATIFGLMGEDPETISPKQEDVLDTIAATGELGSCPGAWCRF